jgi:hypothetical protein
MPFPIKISKNNNFFFLKNFKIKTLTEGYRIKNKTYWCGDFMVYIDSVYYE